MKHQKLVAQVVEEEILVPWVAQEEATQALNLVLVTWLQVEVAVVVRECHHQQIHGHLFFLLSHMLLPPQKCLATKEEQELGHVGTMTKDGL